ncbi:MAG: hypothetical protein RBR42_01125 [Desulfomicrobium sp.]|nr:hypothetical protein [Desulfomicrobium sp.]
MTQLIKNYSSAIYGSVARNDCDIYSDKDLLYAYDQGFYPDSSIISKQKAGWNCSAYTYENLDYLSKIGALFIQHLKQDSVIVWDHNERLSNIVSKYTPKKEYCDEIKEASEFFGILNFIEDSQKGYGWALDVLAIGFRNFNILNFANKRIYEFSFKKILEASKHLYCLSNKETDSLCLLRQYKYMYRNHENFSKYHKESLKEIVSIFNCKLNIKFESNFVPSERFFAVQNNAIKVQKYNGYQRFRLAESIFNSVSHLLGKDTNQLYRQIISNPRVHAYTFNHTSFIDSLMRNLLPS